MKLVPEAGDMDGRKRGRKKSMKDEGSRDIYMQAGGKTVEKFVLSALFGWLGAAVAAALRWFGGPFFLVWGCGNRPP